MKHPNAPGSDILLTLKAKTLLTVEQKQFKKKRIWLEDEEKRLIQGIRLYGRSWGKVAKVVGTRDWYQSKCQALKLLSRFSNDSSMPDADILPILQTVDTLQLWTEDDEELLIAEIR